MKVALLQFAPEVGKVRENVQRADDILMDTSIPADLDWLVLPEMAFSGEHLLSKTGHNIYVRKKIPDRKRDALGSTIGMHVARRNRRTRRRNTPRQDRFARESTTVVLMIPKASKMCPTAC